MIRCSVVFICSMKASFSFHRRVLVSIRSWIEVKPYSTVEKCAVIIFDNEKMQNIKLNQEDTGLVDI